MNETPKHEVHIEPGVSPWLRMTYQSVCECGWKGEWWPFKGAAREQGEEHEDGEPA